MSVVHRSSRVSAVPLFAVLLAALTALAPCGRAQSPLFVELHRLDPPPRGVLGDLDNDGDLDLLGADGLYLNDGDGAFASASSTHLPPGVSGIQGTLADIDGDGDLDAMGHVVSPVPRLELYRNDGTGVLIDVSAGNLPANAPAVPAAFGDVDGDGDLDAMLSNRGLLLNDGTGRFVDASGNLPATAFSFHPALLGDVDGDGDLDAVIGPTYLFVNDGTGVFTDVGSTSLPPLPPTTNLTNALAMGDVDGDNDLDLVVGNSGFGFGFPYGAQNLLWLNDGAGVFTDASTNLPTYWDWTAEIALADLDGDSDLDLLFGNGAHFDFSVGAYTSQNICCLNDGAGVFTDVTGVYLPLDTNTSATVNTADVDGDGDVDLLGNRFYRNDGLGVLVDASAGSLAPESDRTTALALGDLDGDGDHDLVCAYVSNSPLLASWTRLLFNDGAGYFSDPFGNLFAAGTSIADLALGDVDGDGDLDLVAGSSGQNRLYTNDASGQLTDVTATQMPSALDLTEAVVLADVDGDGDPDLFVANDGQNHLYLNDGAGRFTDATVARLPVAAQETRDARIADFDGDGDLDILAGNGGQLSLHYHEPNSLYLNDGTGRFVDVSATNLPINFELTVALVVGDLDGDGDVDAVIGNAGVVPNRLYLNDGTGRFADMSYNLPYDPTPTTAIATADVDADGDLDVVVAQSDSHAVHLNGGRANFWHAYDQGPVVPYAACLALGDVDDDEDIDLLFGCLGQDRLLTNPTRQLAWRAIPRVGKPLTMDVYGAPGQTWVLVDSLGRAAVSYPFGTVRIDLGAAAVVGAGPIGTAGHGNATFTVPANAALIGWSLYWQAVVMGPVALTNLEITTFTGL